MPGQSWAARRERYWGAPVPPNLKHGQVTYVAKVYGCACSACLPSGKRTYRNDEARERPFTPTERRKRSRHNLRGKPVPEGVKHGIYTYKVYQCRCAPCCQAEADRKSRARPPWQAKARGRWTESKDSAGFPVDVICWPPAGAGPDWKCPDPTHERR